MDKKIRVGILGGGGILGAHAPGFRKMADRCTVVAVAEPVAAKGERIRTLLGEEVVIYDSYEELLERADVDAVDILLPHDLHLPATEAAARAGKHILTEKVMARNIWECDRMIEACEGAGVTLTVCHDRRYHGQWQALKTVIDSGLLGEISYWKLDHNQDVDPTAAGIHWIAARDALGGGAIMSCLTHQIDALRWYGGEATSVTCMTKDLPERMQGETIGVVIAQMESGALAQLSINWTTRSGRDSIFSPGASADANGLWYEMVQVCGSKGEAYYMAGRGTFAMTYEEGDIETLIPCEKPVSQGSFARVKTGDWTGHERCVAEWIKSLCGEPAEIVTSGRAVRGTVELAEAAYRAAETGRVVQLPIEPKPWA
jgi:UDP-N-acetyl-2-amino-2-deoxyglucuronate dehydrogenase